MSDLQSDAAAAGGMIFHRMHDLPSFLRSAHHRQHESFGTHIHGASDVMVFFRRNPDDGWKLGRFEIAHDALDGFEVKSRMLAVAKHEVASGGLQNVADAGRGEFDDEMPELRRLRLGHGFESVVRHCRFLPGSAGRSVRACFEFLLFRYSDPAQTSSPTRMVLLTTRPALEASKRA